MRKYPSQSRSWTERKRPEFERPTRTLHVLLTAGHHFVRKNVTPVTCTLLDQIWCHQCQNQDQDNPEPSFQEISVCEIRRSSRATPRTMLLLILTLVVAQVAADPPYPYKVDIKLNDFNQVSVNWRSDQDQKRVHFALECSLESDVAWMTFGFSNHGEYPDSDVCLWNGDSLQDAHIESLGAIRVDEGQYWHFEHLDRYPDGRMALFFWRPYDTCQDGNYIIQGGTTHLVVVIGKTKRLNVFGDHVWKAVQPARLIHPVSTPVMHMDSSVEMLEVTAKNVTIPSQETTYWCTVIKLPNMGEKRHVIKYESLIQKGNEGFVHHMEVYHCEKPSLAGRGRFPMYNGECRVPTMPSMVKSCKRVMGAWAMGAPPLVYPQEAGAPIGGPGYFPFVMLETHYNNPGQKSGAVDSSGIRFYYTSQLRPFDAGVIEVGLEYTDRMAIPPGQPSFTLNGYCTPECTDALLPNQGITLFASQLHSHLTGRELSTSLFREGVEIAVINRDRHFSTHWQEIRPVHPIRVLPGDALVTTCIYDTKDRRNITLGGYGIAEEMCVNYIHYYPKSKLEVCKSAIDPSALESFFEFVSMKEGQPTKPGNSVADNYNAIHWNSRLTHLLTTLYDVAPVKDECRRNDGELVQLPPRPPVPLEKLLPEEPRQCSTDYQE